MLSVLQERVRDSCPAASPLRLSTPRGSCLGKTFESRTQTAIQSPSEQHTDFRSRRPTGRQGGETKAIHLHRDRSRREEHASEVKCGLTRPPLGRRA